MLTIVPHKTRGSRLRPFLYLRPGYHHTSGTLRDEFYRTEATSGVPPSSREEVSEKVGSSDEDHPMHGEDTESSH